MVFKIISQIITKKDKSSFVEKTSIFIRLVECLAQSKSLNFDVNNDSIEERTILKLKEIGIIENGDEVELELLSTLLKNDFKPFIRCVNFLINNENLFDGHLDKLNNSKRLNIQQKEAKSNKPTFVDFFCGAGGLSLGFIKAGFKVVFANDNEDVCIDTYSYNHPELSPDKILNQDIRIIVNDIENYINTDVDVVAGGPPCQGFSSANQQRIIDDPRNELYKYFLKAVEKLCPKFVVMENVRGMLPYSSQIIEDYKNIKSVKNGIEYDYSVSCKLLVSDDYGVAQKRHRLIFIAVRNDLSILKGITSEKILDDIIEDKKNHKNHILIDALSHIKTLNANRIKNTNEIDSDENGKKIDVNNFRGNENNYLKLINSNRQIPLVFNHKSRYVNDINYEIYKTLNQGEDATNEKIKHIMPYAHRNEVFKDKYYKLIADKPSRTITAHLRMDCHSHIHPFQIRSITPREAARIQSFPDDYLFLGAYLKTYMQIGNAVPPLMAEAIAKQLKKYL
jgi:DNA (cytosine-5)-methyltransferase 1